MKKCLIVDDVEVSRFAGRLFLEELGFEVIEAEDAKSAQALLSNSLDVVLLDWHLRKESGLDFLRDLRKTYVSLPVIMFSGVEGSENASEAHSAGANGFITKPTTKEKIESEFKKAGIL